MTKSVVYISEIPSRCYPTDLDLGLQTLGLQQDAGFSINRRRSPTSLTEFDFGEQKIGIVEDRVVENSFKNLQLFRVKLSVSSFRSKQSISRQRALHFLQ